MIEYWWCESQVKRCCDECTVFLLSSFCLTQDIFPFIIAIIMQRKRKERQLLGAYQGTKKAVKHEGVSDTNCN